MKQILTGLILSLGIPVVLQNHDSVTHSFSKNHGQKQHLRNQEPAHKSILDTSSTPVLTAAHHYACAYD